MNSRNGLNLGLLLLLLVLVAVVYVDWQGQSQDETSAKLLPFAPEDVQSIVIESVEGERVQLQRDAQGWQMRAPHELAVDEVRLQKVLEVFTAVPLQRYPLAADADLAQYGLERPQVSVQLNDQRYEFGSVTGLAQRRYLRHGDQLYVIVEPELAMFTAGWAFFADRRLLPPAVELTALQLPGLAELTLVDGAWHWAEATQPLAQDDAVGLVLRWQQAQALRVSALRVDDAADVVVEESLLLRWAQGERHFLLLRDEYEWRLQLPELAVQYHLSPAQGARLTQLSESVE